MIVLDCYLEDYGWIVKVFYEVSREDIDIVLSELEEIEDEAFNSLNRMLQSGIPNQGFTYTDDSLRMTYIVMYETSSATEFGKLFDHEKGHAVSHIGRYFLLDPYGEEIQYLSEELCHQMLKIGKLFLCDHCRLQFNNFGKIKIKMY